MTQCAVCGAPAEFWMYDFLADESFPACADCVPVDVLLIEEDCGSREDRRDQTAATSAA